ncbi:MAG TPA: gamma-glutamylcyclotransferase family protein [Rubrobacter sp.]|nr:gamma-glutamylcyclotransferase family protein [Rubrobacter sp.]
MLTIFVYGTLKRGERNHGYCSGALRVEEGAVRGELYDLPRFGYPELIVPEESVRAFGTDDYLGDAELQARLSPGSPSPPESPLVYGEILVFDDPGSRLPAIDRLEGFDPAEDSSRYRRVLLPVELEEGPRLLAWAYAVSEPWGAHVPDGRWPP